MMRARPVVGVVEVTVVNVLTIFVKLIVAFARTAKNELRKLHLYIDLVSADADVLL